MTQSAGSSLFIIFILVHRRRMTHNSARMQKTYTMTLIFACLDTTGTPHPSPWILATLNCSLTVQDFVKQAVAEAVKAALVHIHVALLMAHGDCDIAVPKHNSCVVLWANAFLTRLEDVPTPHCGSCTANSWKPAATKPKMAALQKKMLIASLIVESLPFVEILSGNVDCLFLLNKELLRNANMTVIPPQWKQ